MVVVGEYGAAAAADVLAEGRRGSGRTGQDREGGSGQARQRARRGRERLEGQGKVGRA